MTRKNEHSHSHRGAEDAAWHTQFEAEDSLAAGGSMAEVSLVSEKCYERIRLDVAARRMKQARFPSRLGRMALAQHQAPSGMNAAGSVARCSCGKKWNRGGWRVADLRQMFCRC